MWKADPPGAGARRLGGVRPFSRFTAPIRAGRGPFGCGSARAARHRQRGLLPDLTLLLEVPATLTAARLAARDGDHADRIGGRPAEYHARVAAAFARFAEAGTRALPASTAMPRRGGAWRGDGRAALPLL
jgi:hypothetical protein